MTRHKHLKRLNQVWVDTPIFFITTGTHQRKPILANAKAANILIEEWSDALERHGWKVGRFVIMPDHVHFFCGFISKGKINESGFSNSIDLSAFIQQWKQWTSKRILREYRDALQSPIWQPEFFDHLIRSRVSYEQKWEYVFQNPVRKGLVEKAEDWKWQGEIYLL